MRRVSQWTAAGSIWSSHKHHAGILNHFLLTCTLSPSYERTPHSNSAEDSGGAIYQLIANTGYRVATINSQARVFKNNVAGTPAWSSSLGGAVYASTNGDQIFNNTFFDGVRIRHR